MTCPACKDKRLHTPEDWKHHPYKGHGYAPEYGGWTHPDLKLDAIARNAALETWAKK